MDNTINGRTPEEIKRGLECCTDVCDDGCDACVYDSQYNRRDKLCLVRLKIDALALIQRLEAERDELLQKNQQLERERDAAVEYLHGWCEVCVHWGSEDSIAFCDGCSHNYPFEHETNFTDNWQWRGVQEQEEK